MPDRLPDETENKGESAGAGSVLDLVGSAFTLPAPLLLASPAIIIAIMVWAFAFDGEKTPVAYLGYTVSVYLLVAFFVTCAKALPNSSFRRHVAESRIINSLNESRGTRMRAGLLIGYLLDMVWAVGNLALGIAEASVWYVTFGCYYGMLAIMRGLVAYRLVVRPRTGEDMRSERIERACGIGLLLSVFVLSGMVTLVMSGLGSIYYADWIVYAVALFTFYFLISTIANYVSARQDVDPLVRANAAINLSIGLVSLFSLEIAMFSSFGTAEDAQLMFVMPIVTGAVIALLLLYLGSSLIRRSVIRSPR